MANHKSAAKRARQATKRTQRNRSVRSSLRTAVRHFREAVAATDKAAAEAALKTATRLVRKAASAGVLHKRTASRYVSRLSLAWNKIAQ